MRLIFLVAALSAATAAATTGVHAQSVPGSPTGLLIDQGRAQAADSVAPQAPATGPHDPDYATSIASGVANTAPIRSVRFDNGEAPSSVAEAARPYLGQPASQATLQAIADALSKAYARSSVALYSVAIPAQSLSDGVLHVRFAEGYIEQIQIIGDVKGGAVALVKRYAQALSAERPLSRRSLERYLSLIRDIPGLTVEASLLRGQNAGAVRLVLKLKQKRHDFAVSFDNRSQEQLSSGEFQAVAKAFGTLRAGDETDVTLAAATDFRAFRYANIAHSTPIGGDGLRATLSVAHLETRARPSDIEGEANIVSLGLSEPLIRSYKRNLTLSASTDLVNSDNAVLGSLLARERTRAARAAAVFSDAGDRHLLSASLIASRGLDLLGADTRLTLADPRFTKVDATASLSRTLGKRFVARINASGQWTDDALPAVERFLVGGEPFGRAFPVATLAADRGVAGSVELAWRPAILKALSGSELYLFTDRADARYVARGPLPGASYQLASAGIGTRILFRDKDELDLEGARRIDRPYPGFPADWQFNVAWRASFGRK